jgi:branched-chain amino acid transport system ATP-binding protein
LEGSSEDTILSVRDLCVAYGKVEAVHNAKLRVRAGEIVTVIGPNGAGKTTLLSAIIGLLPSRGEIRFLNAVHRSHETESMVGLGMNLVPEKRELFGDMSVEDNLALGAYWRYRRGERDPTQTMEWVFSLFPRLRERREQSAGTLSGGERQMLALGRALMAKPRLLMLDEPSLGLAPLIARGIFRTIAELRESGVAILMVEQNARAALQIADYGYVLEMGTVVLEGPSRELSNDARVVESYLGLGGKR